jgi:tRNA(fMet)-specific endonuclease VapC
VILDTNVVSALFAGDEKLGKILASKSRHELPVIVVGEYRYGLRRSRVRKTLEPLLDQLIAESVVLDVDLETARVYAEVREKLRASGRPIPENDIWIAALGLQHDLPVVSRDRDFASVQGLHHVTW